MVRKTGGYMLQKYVCKICGCDTGSELIVKEMFHGSRENFTYYQCSSCGTIQIAHVPEDMSKYYPSDYYSFVGDGGRGGCLSQVIKKYFFKYIKYIPLFVRDMLNKKYKSLDYVLWHLKNYKDKTVKILDYGCGCGVQLRRLRSVGYTNAVGMDPFITNDLFDATGNLVVKRGSIDDVEDAFDLIEMHHALEHTENPVETVRSLCRHLLPGGKLLLRFPVCDGRAFEMYGSGWVQLDAPRHLCLLTKKAVCLLAEKLGLKIISYTHDSTAFQFLGSELYKRDIPLCNALKNGKISQQYFSTAEVQKFEHLTERVNTEGCGDQVFVFLEVSYQKIAND